MFWFEWVFIQTSNAVNTYLEGNKFIAYRKIEKAIFLLGFCYIILLACTIGYNKLK